MVSEIITKLYRQGLSLIPVDEETKKAKVAFAGKAPLDPNEIWDAMEAAKTRAVAVVLGEVSERCVCIDIDTKYKAGFDAVLFSSLEKLYPEIWSLVRVEKTPSGGAHIFYKIAKGEKCPSSYKMASRLATEQELLEKPKEKSKCFLEIKGNGGLTQIYPSPKYSVLFDRPIPVLTWEQHMSLHYLCIGFNEIEEVKKIKADLKDSEFYSVNPYEDFDGNKKGEEVLKNTGWTFSHSVGHFDYYMRPEKKTKEVSASFNHKTRNYTIFTTQTEVDRKTYSPSNLLCFLEFADDKKELFKWLVKEGYGKLKPNAEKNIVKKAAKYGYSLPENVSSEGKELFEEEKKKKDERYPFGIFWEEAGDDFKISRENVYIASRGLGFRLFKDIICRINGHEVELINERKYFDELKKYINNEEERYEDICNAYETFLQKSGKFTISRIELLDEGMILRPDALKSYKFYANGYVEITGTEIEFKSWVGFDKFVWKHDVQPRDFRVGTYKESLYYKFLEKAVRITEHSMRCIGYYAHDFKNTTQAYIVVLCEECEDAKNGGGAGKNIFTNLFKFTTTLVNKSAENIKFDNTLLRLWKYERIFSINDVGKNFEYLSLKELASGTGEMNKKHIQEDVIENVDMPKFMVNTNFSFNPNQPGLKRRLVPLEFTDFFTKAGGVDAYFGKYFPQDKNGANDWTDLDWIGYDNFIMLCIQKFLQNKCKLTIPDLTDSGWIKQFDQNFGQLTHQFIKDHINGWCDLINVSSKTTFNVEYLNFCNENNIDKRYQLAAGRMNDALIEYCGKHGIEFTKNHSFRNHLNNMDSGRKFVRTGEAKEIPKYEYTSFEESVGEEEDFFSNYNIENPPF